MRLFSKLKRLPHAHSNTQEAFFPWQGVYSSFHDVPSRGPGCDDDRWIAEYAAGVRQLRRAYSTGLDSQQGNYGEHQTLCLLAALVACNRDVLRVLDYGGGLGPAFVHLVNTVRNLGQLDYRIVDTPRMCGEGSELFVDDGRITFSPDLPDIAVDIAYVNSALQYFPDYAATLRKLCSLRPPYVLLARLGAGRIRTFATAQMNVPDSVIPYWFFDESEIIALLGAFGYRLLFRSEAAWSYDLTNFSPEYRLSGTVNLLWGRNDED